MPENNKKNTPKPKTSLNLGANEKLRLRLYNGKHELMTIEDALKPYNHKRLAQSAKDAISKGKLVTTIVEEINAQ